MTVKSRPTEIPVVPPPPRVRPPHAQRTTLSNGLRVLIVPQQRLPVVDVLLVFESGAAADPIPSAGLAQLTAHLADSGTTTRSQFEIAAALDAIGARMDAAAGWDHTTLSLHALSARIDEGLAVMADVVMNASFPLSEFERGRDERLADILQDLDDPDTVADLAIARAIYGSHHAYGVAAGGTRATIDRLEQADLVRFHAARYRPVNGFAVIAGDVDPDRVHGRLEHVFEGWNAGRPTEDAQPAAAPQRPTAIHLIDRPGAPQSEFRIGRVGVARSSPDYFPIVVMNTVLGGSFTSRLNVRLRERGGYTYGAYTGFSFRKGPGPFYGGAAVFTGATDRAIAESLEEIERMRDEPVTAEELQRATRYMMLGLPRVFETSGGIASRIAEIELHGLGAAYWDEFAERVAAVDTDGVLSAARRTLDSASMQIVVVGDAAVLRGPLEKLGVGPVLEVMPPE
jgi:zinc protease